jgi:hypothetical protein
MLIQKCERQTANCSFDWLQNCWSDSDSNDFAIKQAGADEEECDALLEELLRLSAQPARPRSPPGSDYRNQEHFKSLQVFDPDRGLLLRDAPPKSLNLQSAFDGLHVLPVPDVINETKTRRLASGTDPVRRITLIDSKPSPRPRRFFIFWWGGLVRSAYDLKRKQDIASVRKERLPEPET